MSHTTTTRLTRAQSIQQAQADIRTHLSAYKQGKIQAGWALEEINRIAAFYAHRRVDAYANTARNQIAKRELVKPKCKHSYKYDYRSGGGTCSKCGKLHVILLFLLLPIFAPAQANTYREAMRIPPAKAPVTVAYRDTTQVQRKWNVQPVAVMLPRRVKSKCSISFIQPSFR